MIKNNINQLLLKTAFSCMACDGVIDQREVDLIKSMHHERKLFGEIEIDAELNDLLSAINNDGNKFLREYFYELTSAELTEQDEMRIIEAAVDTIMADESVEYSEIKFFKVIRSKLKIDDEQVLKVRPDFEEYLEEDVISESYLAKLQIDFFEVSSLPQFKLLNIIDEKE